MKQSVFEIVVQFFSKHSEIIIGSLVGVGARIAIDSKTRRLSWLEMGGKAIIGLACGIIAYNYCKANDIGEKTKVIVPLATMLGESIIVWLMRNVNPLLRVIAARFAGVDKNELDKDIEK